MSEIVVREATANEFAATDELLLGVYVDEGYTAPDLSSDQVTPEDGTQDHGEPTAFDAWCEG